MPAEEHAQMAIRGWGHQASLSQSWGLASLCSTVQIPEVFPGKKVEVLL